MIFKRKGQEEEYYDCDASSSFCMKYYRIYAIHINNIGNVLKQKFQSGGKTEYFFYIQIIVKIKKKIIFHAMRENLMGTPGSDTLKDVVPFPTSPLYHGY